MGNHTMRHSTAVFALFAALLFASSYCEVAEEVSNDIAEEVPEPFDSDEDHLVQDKSKANWYTDLVQDKEGTHWRTRRLTPPSNLHELKRCCRRYCHPVYHNRRVDCGSKRHAYLVAINCLIGTAA